MKSEQLRALAERARTLEDDTPARLVDVHARIAAVRRRRRSAALVSVAGVLALVALTFVLVDTDPDRGTPEPAPAPSSSSTPDPTTASGAEVHRPADGTCWVVPASSAVLGSRWYDASPQVPCSQQHTTETVTVLALDEPTVEEAQRWAVDMCWDYVRLYLGVDQRSWIPWTMAAFLPSKEQISDGASWIRCDATFPAEGTSLDQARTTTGSAAGLADDPPPDLWACTAAKPTPSEPLVPCDGPHAYEQTGRLALLTGLDEYPTKQERETAAAQCEAGIPQRLRGLAVYVVWDPRSEFEPNGDVAGVCLMYDPDGGPLPPRPATEGTRP